MCYPFREDIEVDSLISNIATLFPQNWSTGWHPAEVQGTWTVLVSKLALYGTSQRRVRYHMGQCPNMRKRATSLTASSGWGSTYLCEPYVYSLCHTGSCIKTNILRVCVCITISIFNVGRSFWLVSWRSVGVPDVDDEWRTFPTICWSISSFLPLNPSLSPLAVVAEAPVVSTSMMSALPASVHVGFPLFFCIDTLL